MNEHDERELRFADDLGAWFERMGATRMVGRVWGLLLSAEEPLLSAAEIAERLGASAGAISGATRDLIALGILERRRVPGERRDYFAVRPDSYVAIVRRRLQAISDTARIGERGMREFEDRPAAAERFRELYDFYTWLAPRFATLIDEWEADKETTDDRTE